MPQLFVKVGPDKFVPVDYPRDGEDTYEWNSELGQIILQTKAVNQISTA